MKPVQVRIFYPADPLGVVPGGIDTFIRGLIQHAPAELAFSLVGMTTDGAARPAGRWSRQALGGQPFDFFPAVQVADAGRRGFVPLSVRYTAAVARHRRMLARDLDVFDFHRLEPSLLYAADTRPKNAFFHQDPTAISAAGSDILWRHLPAGYRLMEAALAPRLSSAWCVRDTSVGNLQRRYPALAEAIRFVPTWVDAKVCSPVDAATRARLRDESAAALGISPEVPRIVSVGRLDGQKDPMLLLESFACLACRQGERSVLLIVGDGALRPALERKVAALGIGAKVRFLGLCSPPQVADILRAADVYALSSAYEGMPMAMLEALGCGLPVATTDVGEVRRVVWPGVNGAIATERSVGAYAACLGNALANRDRYKRHTVSAVQRYQPARVLGPVYENYLALAKGRSGIAGSPTRLLSRLPTVDASAALPLPPYAERQREQVLGTLIDSVSPADACAIIVRWATARESRTVSFCNVHSIVHARRHPAHRAAIEQSDLAAADGAPIAWTLSAKRRQHQPRTSGPDLMLQVCEAAAGRNLAVGLYGSVYETLDKLKAVLRRRFPSLRITYLHAPPFRLPTEFEDRTVCADIEAAGVALLFVALGCPKQEAWMAEHRGRVNAVMLGVGAAFDFHAGTVGRAPAWMRANGLEWLHRLAHNPQRLAARYTVTNTLFVMETAAELATAMRSMGLRAIPGPSSGRRGMAGSAPSSRQHRQRRSPMRGSQMRKKLASHHVDELVARVDASLPPVAGRMIEFIAGSAREGTTTLATAYARALSERQRRVLLITAHREKQRGSGPSLVPFSAHSPSPPRRHADGYNVAKLRPTSEADADSGYGPALPEAVWAALRASYDTIVMDMPPLSASRAGLLVAPRCDGVVVVVEAEKSRAPVSQALVSSLRSVRANVLGTVLNKRRFHIPTALYRLL